MALAEEFLERSLRKESHYIPAARHALVPRTVNGTGHVANSHENLGVALGHRGDYVEAERHLETCVEMRRTLPSPKNVARALAKLHEVRARRARECPDAPTRPAAASRVASLPPGVVLPYLPAA